MPQDDTTVSTQVPDEQPKKKGLFVNPFAKHEITPADLDKVVITPDTEQGSPAIRQPQFIQPATPAKTALSELESEAAALSNHTTHVQNTSIGITQEAGNGSLSALRQQVMNERVTNIPTPPPNVPLPNSNRTIPPQQPIHRSLDPKPAEVSPVTAPPKDMFVHGFNATALDTDTRGVAKSFTPTAGSTQPYSSPIKSLRTLKDDMSSVIMRRQVSLVNALAAEENKRSKALDTMPAGKTVALPPALYFILGITVSLFVLGGAALAVGFFFANKASVIPQTELPSYIFTEAQVQLRVDNKARSGIMDDLIAIKKNLNATVGTITQVYFTKMEPSVTGAKATLVLVPIDEWFETMDLHAPGQLTRSLTQKLLFGFHQFNDANPFIILKTSSYENAFAGMLEWEGSLNADLSPLFGPIVTKKVTPIQPEEPEIPTDTQASTSTQTPELAGALPIAKTKQVSSSTSTSTPKEELEREPRSVPNLYFPQRFVDAVIHNVEVRILKDEKGSIVLVYGFFDRNTIIIANNENTFKEVIVRLTSQR